MLIAVHRRGVVVHKKAMGILNRNTTFTPRAYIFISAFPFNPFWNHVIKSQNYLLTKFFMSKKYIQPSITIFI